jgi:predicted transcriptional regulator
MEVARNEAEDPQPVETVGEVMSSGVVTIAPDAEITEAAKVMVIQDVKRLPVVDEDNKMLGIISRLDIVAVFTRPDEVIEDEIREDLLRRVLFVDPDDVVVEVEGGVVTFRGEIGTKNESRILEELSRRLDGVMRVDNQLAWRIED